MLKSTIFGKKIQTEKVLNFEGAFFQENVDFCPNTHFEIALFSILEHYEIHKNIHNHAYVNFPFV